MPALLKGPFIDTSGKAKDQHQSEKKHFLFRKRFFFGSFGKVINPSKKHLWYPKKSQKTQIINPILVHIQKPHYSDHLLLLPENKKKLCVAQASSILGVAPHTAASRFSKASGAMDGRTRAVWALRWLRGGGSLVELGKGIRPFVLSLKI